MTELWIKNSLSVFNHDSFKQICKYSALKLVHAKQILSHIFHDILRLLDFQARYSAKIY